MLADAGHSSLVISDGLSHHSHVCAADDVDPLGHGRFESVGSLAIGSLLIMAGASFATAIAAFNHPRRSVDRVLVTSISIIAKEALYRATAIGRSSPVLMAVRGTTLGCALVGRRHHRHRQLLLGWKPSTRRGMVVAGMVRGPSLSLSLSPSPEPEPGRA